MNYWQRFIKSIESMCEYIEDKFTACVGEKNSKAIGDFFLLSFLVSRPSTGQHNQHCQNNQTMQYQLVETSENPCAVTNEEL
jgi:hypothetical protein